MEFNWGVGHLFGGLRNSSVLNIHPLKIRVVHLVLSPAPSPQVEHYLGFASEHITEIFTYLEIVDVLSLYKTPNKHICSVLFLAFFKKNGQIPWGGDA